MGEGRGVYRAFGGGDLTERDNLGHRATRGIIIIIII